MKINQNQTKYIHKEFDHRLTDSDIICEALFKIIGTPKSMIDVGCGTGTFLLSAKEKGVSVVLGIDGDWVDQKLLFTNIDRSEFQKFNLTEIYFPHKKYDLAVCSEVAEHLEEKYADNIIKTLVQCSDVVLFSAAIPGQYGQFHVNEQAPQYWIDKFKRESYLCFDVIRPIIWENTQVKWWYKQNLLLFIRDTHPYAAKLASVDHLELKIHPELLAERTKQYTDIIDGNRGWIFYFKLLLKKLVNAFR